MLEKYFSRPGYLQRLRSSWIGPALEKYVTWLSDNEYSPNFVRARVPTVLRFARFARARGVDNYKQLPAHVEAFIKSCLAERVTRRTSAHARRQIVYDMRGPVQHVLRLVVPGFVGAVRSRKYENPFAQQAPSFFDYLRREKGLRESTIEDYALYLEHIAKYLKSIRLRRLDRLTPRVLSRFITGYAPQLGPSGVKSVCHTARVFLRYLHREGVLSRDLSPAVEYPQTYRLATLPRSITWAEVQRLLRVPNRKTAWGKRDYAMLLLMVTYGLRACEVAAITLDDIDWRKGRLRVPQRKAGHSSAYPLSAIVGRAIIEYLKKGRPKTVHRQIFIKSVAPYTPTTSGVISWRTGNYLRKAAIDVPCRGSHTLRHTCVQRLVEADFPLKVIGDYVGHGDPASTQIYSKVAVSALREVAMGDVEAIL